MGVLTNPKHELFAQALAKGKTQVDAYADADYDAVGKIAEAAASRLLRNVKVAARVAELQKGAARRVECTVADIARQLDEDRDFARQLDNPSAAISATLGKAKVLGLIVDKAEFTGKNGGPVHMVTETADEHEDRTRRVAQEF